MHLTLLAVDSFLLYLLSMPTSYDYLGRDVLFVICITKARVLFSIFQRENYVTILNILFQATCTPSYS